jgi:hypothetical protein
VPVSLPPEAGPKLDAEICCRIWNLPEALCFDHMYLNPQFWYDFLAWEHTAHHRSTFQGEYQPWDAYPIEDPLPPDEEDGDDYDIVKEEADEAMEDAALLGIGDLSPGIEDLHPKYQAVIAAGYDKDALLQ